MRTVILKPFLISGAAKLSSLHIRTILSPPGVRIRPFPILKSTFRLKWCEPNLSSVSALDVLHSLPRPLPRPRLITEEEVCEVLATCKAGKSCGDNGISYEFLQLFMQTECRVHFVEWFNSVLFQTSPIPPTWLSSKLTLLPKVPQPSCPSDLRPIVLSSTRFYPRETLY